MQGYHPGCDNKYTGRLFPINFIASVSLLDRCYMLDMFYVNNFGN